MPSRDWRTLRDELKAQGWTVAPTNNGHFKATPPGGHGRIVHYSESAEPRAFMNTVSDLRKQGFTWGDSKPPSIPKISLPPMLPEVPAFELPLRECGFPCPEPDLSSESPVPFPKASDRSDDLDRAFGALKEAKAYEELAREHHAEAEARLVQAQRELGKAQKELAAAVNDLAEKKRAFDAAFDPETRTRTKVA